MWRLIIATVLAIVGGMCLALQSAVNARMRGVLGGSPWGAAMVSVVISSFVLLAISIAVGEGGQIVRSVGGGPLWAYLGGIFGVIFLVTSLIAVTRMGATVTYIAVTLGGTVSAAVADHFGLLGLARVDISWQRIGAVLLMCAALGLLLHDALTRTT